MLVYKFGGASVQDAKAIKNVANIINTVDSELLIVISAMGKMTNAFEQLINAYFSSQPVDKALKNIVDFHEKIIHDLEIEVPFFYDFLLMLEAELKQEPTDAYNFEYDRLIGYGELFSTMVVGTYLKQTEASAYWLDIRKIIKTDDNFRFAKVDWEQTTQNAQDQIDFSKHRVYLTQGFISSNKAEQTTSLGREGSDYSAAILSYVLSAESITIWKDVPGVLNADPRLTENAELLPELSFYDAIELAFFGAQIIHPKTIQPLKNKKIPLYVRSFINLECKGTLVNHQKTQIKIPIVIVKENQVLLSIRTRDFSFVDEKNISSIFAVLSKYNAKVNMMQNGAVSFSIVVDYLPMAFDQMIEMLSIDFDIKYNSNLKLITIRHYTSEKIEALIGAQDVFIEQRSRNTAQYLVNSDR